MICKIYLEIPIFLKIQYIMYEVHTFSYTHQTKACNILRMFIIFNTIQQTDALELSKVYETKRCEMQAE